MTDTKTCADWKSAAAKYKDSILEASEIKFKVLEDLLGQDNISKADAFNFKSFFADEIEALQKLHPGKSMHELSIWSFGWLSPTTILDLVPSAQWPRQETLRGGIRMVLDNKAHIILSMTKGQFPETLLPPNYRK